MPHNNKVLIVDDRPENILSLELLLSDSGLDIVSASSGEEALARTLDHEFVLIFMDVQMPGMNGYETAELLRSNKKTKSIPIIFVTAESKNKQDVFKGYDAGAVDYLFKPLDPMMLRCKVDVFLELQHQKRKLQAKTRELDAKVKELEELQHQLEQKNEQLELLSTLDSLTGVVNRRRFDEIIGHEWRRAIRSGRVISLIFSDVDYFKKFNDTYGHIAGDKCLRKIAQALSSSLQRHVDTVARYGGEEFAAILPETEPEGVLQVVKRMQKAIKDLRIPHASSDVSDFVSVSFGLCSVHPRQELSHIVLVEAADKALYQAKLDGRNCFRTCSDFLSDSCSLKLVSDKQISD